MHIILGGTGHVGSALAEALLARKEAVTVVTRDGSKARDWERKGARVAIADVYDTDNLRRVFRTGRRLFLLNPNAPPSTDNEAEERRSLRSILSAIDGSGLEKIVAESTYGAQPLERGGDIGVLYEMEQALAAQPIPSTINRAAYYMSNWDSAVETATQEGVVHSFFPADFTLPMVAPHDIGLVAADLMTEPIERTGLRYVEGPERYSASDVAAAFTTALGRHVGVNVIPREHWVKTFRALGFSEAAAESYAAMTAITIERLELPEAATRGRTSIERYVRDLLGADPERAEPGRAEAQRTEPGRRARHAN